MVTSKAAEKTSSASAIGTAAAPSVESLMKRGWLFLEDSNWTHAIEYFDRVLDIDPENVTGTVLLTTFT